MNNFKDFFFLSVGKARLGMCFNNLLFLWYIPQGAAIHPLTVEDYVLCSQNDSADGIFWLGKPNCGILIFQGFARGFGLGFIAWSNLQYFIISRLKQTNLE